MSLLALQRDFGAWLRTGDAADAARLGAAYAPGLDVYQNNYRAQLVACLEATFVRTRAWIGDDAFHDAMVTHVDRVPPNSWTLDAYGRDFPATLAGLYPEDREVGELAWLEWALEEAFVSADHAVLDVAAIAAIDWDGFVLGFSPSLDIAGLSTNAPAIWTALAHEQVPPAAEALPEPAALLVWRHDGASCFRAMDGQERDALLRARATGSFPAVCDMLVARLGEERGIVAAGELLGRWIMDGLILGRA